MFIFFCQWGNTGGGGNSSLNTPIVPMQNPGLSGLYPSSYSGHGGGGGQGQSDFTPDMVLTSLHAVHGGWGAPGSGNSNSSSSSGGIVHHTGHLSNNLHLGYLHILKTFSRVLAQHLISSCSFRSLSHLTVPNTGSQRPPSAPLSPSPVALKIKSEPISPPREAMALQVQTSCEWQKNSYKFYNPSNVSYRSVFAGRYEQRNGTVTGATDWYESDATSSIVFGSPSVAVWSPHTDRY